VTRAVACEGAPRDLGRDQGRACAEWLRAGFASLPLARRLRLRLGVGAAAAGGVRRELRRHFPRQAETLAGIAGAAGVPAAWLEACLETEGEAREPELAIAALREGGQARVLRRLAGEWILRRSQPEGGYRSVEITRPWLAHALLGVNEAGLAAAVVTTAGPRARGGLPSAPLIQDCLQRFAALEAALEWCLARPAERDAALILADAHGEIAAVEIAASGRRVLRPVDGWLAVGGSPAARAELAGQREGGAGLAGLLAADPSAREVEIAGVRWGIQGRSCPEVASAVAAEAAS
jgi:hypothetical protein